MLSEATMTQKKLNNRTPGHSFLLFSPPLLIVYGSFQSLHQCPGVNVIKLFSLSHDRLNEKSVCL